jgi:murein DD-endopeptidase MepM/ murein hydrolase activator NlpD
MGTHGAWRDWGYILTRQSAVFAVSLCVAIGLLHQARSENSTQPLQLEMRVPFEPTAFPSAGRTHLTYELHLTNFTGNPLTLSSIEVLDADAAARKPIAVFEGEGLDGLLQSLGARATGTSRQIAGGGTVVVFMWVDFEPGAQVPKQLRHRVLTADNAAEGAYILTHHTELKVLRSPVQGSNWLASDAPSNDADNHHRRGVFVYDGRGVISRRYAIDWMQIENGASFSGEARDKSAYYSYGKPVVAVADATVVTARDGLPDNVPGHNEQFHPAVPITMDTVGGNTITLDIGGRQFAYYFHLRPGSLRVKVGNHVKKGQIMARIGASGDAREPHLHFEIANSPKALAGEGLPYVIDHYRVKSEKGWESRTRELPLKDMVIDFGR